MTVKRKILAIALPALALQACAYHRPEELATRINEQMARSDALLQQAQTSGAEKDALPELQQAKDEYAEAKTAFGSKSAAGDAKALQLAQRAAVDAQFAAAKAQTVRQQQSADQVEKAVETLRAQAQHDIAAASQDGQPSRSQP